MFTPHTTQDEKEMLAAVGVSSVKELLSQIPAELLYPALHLPAALTEQRLTAHMQSLSAKNKPLTNFIGAGMYEHFIPAAVPALSGRGEYQTTGRVPREVSISRPSRSRKRGFRMRKRYFSSPREAGTGARTEQTSPSTRMRAASPSASGTMDAKKRSCRGLTTAER